MAASAFIGRKLEGCRGVPCPIGVSKHNFTMRDLKFVDEAYRAERKAAGPTDGQIALAETLDEIGNWPMFVTFTFRPNRNEEVIQNEDGAHIQNPRLRWCGGEQVTKRVTRDGGRGLRLRGGRLTKR